jgi:hypothetical protein
MARAMWRPHSCSVAVALASMSAFAHPSALPSWVGGPVPHHGQSSLAPTYSGAGGSSGLHLRLADELRIEPPVCEDLDRQGQRLTKLREERA